MIGAGVIGRPTQRLPGLGTTVRLYLATILGSIILGALVVGGGQGPFLRLLLGALVAFFLIALSLARPGAGIVATLVYLVFMAALRRILIPASAWVSTDPLLLVAPAVAVMLMIKLFVLEHRRLAPDLISKLVLIVLLLTVVETANPTGDGISSNLAGLLFMATPLLWFFVGREVLNDGLIDRLMVLTILLAVVAAGYGLYQTQVGYPAWDTNWLNVTGEAFTSLNVGGKLRAIGPFSSFVEYALFLGSALAAAFAFAIRRHWVAVVAIPLLAVALFLSSNRSGLIMSGLAVVVMLALTTRRPVVAALITLAAVGAAYGGLKLFSGALSSGAAGSSSLVSHQLAGISDPLNSQDSTLLTHFSEVKDGVISSFSHPEGEGPGYTNLAAGLNSSSSLTDMQSTEVDISNAFVDLGPVGGILYLGLVVLVLLRAVIGYFRGRDSLLAVIGLLIVGAGQWLTGGHYALSPFTWLLVGGVAAGSWRATVTSRDQDPGPDRPLWRTRRHTVTVAPGFEGR